ncbi:hypothetical protein JCM10295v2_003636 [Rhodotorula toruloides]
MAQVTTLTPQQQEYIVPRLGEDEVFIRRQRLAPGREEVEVILPALLAPVIHVGGSEASIGLVKSG